MISGRTISPGRVAALGVLALAALALALAPTVSRADEEEQQPPGKGRFGGKFNRGGDDAEQIEKDLKRKMEEIEQFRKRLETARQKGDKKGGSIRVEISGASKEEIERATAALKKAIPGKDVQVGGGPGERRGPGPKAEFRDRGGPGKGPSADRGGDKRPQPKRGPGPKGEPRDPRAEPAKGPPADRRIEGLEKRLNDLVRELEALRKEIRGGGKRGEPKDKGRGPGFGFGGKGGFGPRREQ